MENSPHNSVLRQKLDQHDFGYKPGAWENFDHLLTANPIAAPKKSFWDYKKWFGAGAAALLLIGGALSLNTSKENSSVLPTQQLEISSKTASPILEDKKETKSISVEQSSSKNDIKPEPVMQTMSPNITTKSATQHAQHDDNVLPHEAEVKVRASQPYQRISKSASDESAVFPTSHKTDDHHAVKKNQESIHHGIPDAHELDAPAPKTGKKNDLR